ncbi:Epl1 protein [Dactylonectria estremocensis]|uniref:Epl1 protein n=1 Tax=Dactylonectria estremocensis TaxID=1079267 RepID=A0A9P9DBZ2_9HYPO|nr:Epl1 protein [Dactylonectria estremocensis]
MQLSNILSIFTLATAVSAVSVSYDTGYDDPNRSLTAVSCSDGVNGLMTKHPTWKKQSDIPRFPYIGGAASIAGWNSPNCGLCKKATYKGKTIYVLAIDHTATGLNVGKKAMDALTNNQATQLGRIEATVVNVDKRFCGL